ncbi:MAG: 50S ribosomal protein L44e [Candidatus Ranarchaeia archaeon]
MKMPKIVTVFCSRCRSHTQHTVSLYKAGKRRPNSIGERRYSRKKEGYGSQRKPEQKRFAKVTKKQTLRYKCKTCGYIIMRKGLRIKKLELQ